MKIVVYTPTTRLQGLPLRGQAFSKIFARYFERALYIPLDCIPVRDHEVIISPDSFGSLSDQFKVTIEAPSFPSHSQYVTYGRYNIDEHMDLADPGARVLYDTEERLLCVAFPSANSIVIPNWLLDTSEQSVTTAKAILAKLEELGLIRPIERAQSEIKVTLGCDPEFELFQQGLRVRAAWHFNSTSNEIGCDGHGEQLELRPAPAETPEELVSNIEALIRQLHADGFELEHRGDCEPLGGHIHIGGIEPNNEIIEVLDDFIGHRTLYLSGEARGSYCHPGMYEHKFYGFEYRTPPASIFASPKIARITLAITKGLIERLLNHGSLTYNNEPKATDYVNCAGVSLQDAIYFLAFCKHRLHRRLHIIDAWELQPLEPNQAVFLCQDSYWEPWAKEEIEQVFSGYEFVATIWLYGLSRDRGNVYTFPVPWRNQVRLFKDYNPYRAFGFSRYSRENREEFHHVLDQLRMQLKRAKVIRRKKCA